jgi:hypothetical protein
MKHHLLSALLCSCIFASGCATDKVLRMRSLSTESDPTVSDNSKGMFDGLKALTETAKNTNIVFVHGIGWTQERGSSEFGDDILEAVKRAYPGAKIRTSKYACPTSSLDGRRKVKKEVPQVSSEGGLRVVRTESQALVTDDPNFSVTVSELGCLDRTIIDIPNEKTITLYKFFWDDSMWNSAEWFHMAYDDPIAIDINGNKYGHPGYDDPDKLRAKLNSQLKNSVVTYGLTDAALYMSPIGKAMREGVEAAVCTALADSFELTRVKGSTATTTTLCAESPQTRAPLLLMAHSLGSRIVFDTITNDLNPKLAAHIAAGTTNQTIELHMFANQIPLVGVGRLGAARTGKGIEGKSIRLVAYSEINDLLTYELVPYFEQLYYVRCYDKKPKDSTCKAAGPDEFTKRSMNFFNDPIAREQLKFDLGFDVIDVRLQFAPNLIPFYSGLKNPSIAHSGHMKSDSVLSMLFCGADEGKPKMSLTDCMKK